MIIIVSVIVIAFLVAMMKSRLRGKQIYEALETIFIGGKKESRLERNLKLGAGILLIALMGLFIAGSSVNVLSEGAFLGITLLYLSFYYAMEYTSHHKWCMTKEGFMSSRQLNPTGWENVVNYEWKKRKERLVLKVIYKGRGIMYRKCELVVDPSSRKEVERLLKRHVVCSR